MTANLQPIFPLTPKVATGTIVNADAQTVKTIFTAGANGSRLTKLNLTSTDTSNRDIGIYINAVLIGTVALPLGAGTASTIPAKDVLSDSNIRGSYYDSNGNLVIDLPASAVLGIAAPVSITAAKTVTGIAVAGDF